jgi:hypothetical protein
MHRSMRRVPKPRRLGATTSGPPYSVQSICSTRSGSPRTTRRTVSVPAGHESTPYLTAFNHVARGRCRHGCCCELRCESRSAHHRMPKGVMACRRWAPPSAPCTNADPTRWPRRSAARLRRRQKPTSAACRTGGRDNRMFVESVLWLPAPGQPGAPRKKNRLGPVDRLRAPSPRREGRT